MSESAISEPLYLSIGAVSRATQIPVNTLRTWERRYGFPQPERSDGGHRLYRSGVVERLRLVSRALGAGHRAGQVLGLSEGELRALLGMPVHALPDDAALPIRRWIEAARNLEGDVLDAGFRVEAARKGMLPFLIQRAEPFITAMGDAWERGELRVFHEHFASERLRDFLVSVWRPLSDQAMGPWVVCTTLPGERHFMGLHMAAAVVALAGWRVLFLGVDTPLRDQLECVRQCGAEALMISVSEASALKDSQAHLHELRQLLDPNVEILVGGRGAREGIDGVRFIDDMRELEIWAGRRRA
ncbi:MAG: MerR family DNA-binding transcriptional regulator [Alphaproteobacteria bacterium]|nr:MerR family DNA-binding transcriptional regulator [Alphaproteobacteria bacterium]MCB9794699.1 MerR family DNA-binding transcriptional regulator [Alphaproteobacteria bacterium]